MIRHTSVESTDLIRHFDESCVLFQQTSQPFECVTNRTFRERKNMNGANPRYMQLDPSWNAACGSDAFSFDSGKGSAFDFQDGSSETDIYMHPGLESVDPPPAPKPKKFFKSRDATNSAAPESAPLRKFDLSTLYGPKHKIFKKQPKRRLPPATKNTSGKKLESDPPPSTPTSYLHRAPVSVPAKENKISEVEVRAPLKIVMKKTSSGFHVEASDGVTKKKKHGRPRGRAKKEKYAVSEKEEEDNEVFHEDESLDIAGRISPAVPPPDLPPGVTARSVRYAKRLKSPTSQEEELSPAVETLIFQRSRSKSPRGPRKRSTSGRKRKKRGGLRNVGHRPKKPSPPQATWETLLGPDAIVIPTFRPDSVHNSEPAVTPDQESQSVSDDSPENVEIFEDVMEPCSSEDPRSEDSSSSPQTKSQTSQPFASSEPDQPDHRPSLVLKFGMTSDFPILTSSPSCPDSVFNLTVHKPDDLSESVKPCDVPPPITEPPEPNPMIEPENSCKPVPKRRGRPPKKLPADVPIEEPPTFSSQPNLQVDSQPWLDTIEEEKANSEPQTVDFSAFEPLRQAERIIHIPSRNPSSNNDGRKPRIFFSKSASNRASYKHKWHGDQDEEATKNKAAANAAVTSSDAVSRAYDDFDAEFEPQNAFSDLPKLRKCITAPPKNLGDIDEEAKEIVSLKCGREQKKFFTVVKNVRHGYQIQEIAEFQDFQDDVDYILESLKDSNPIGVRCLSAVSLASKCMVPAFRMHLRAQGTVANFFGALKDAPSDACLSLCTAMTFFVLAQDRLNMDLDCESLNLMLKLIESNTGGEGAEFKETKLDSKELEKHRQKVKEMCAELQSQGHAQTLDLNHITPEHLAVETLLSLTSRRAGEWFKEELRELGGLAHIVNTVNDCLRYLPQARSVEQIHLLPPITWNAKSVEKLKRAERCLRVFQSVTSHNEDNQKYLLSYQNGVLVDCVMKLCELSANEIPSYSMDSFSVRESLADTLLATLLSSMKVLLLLAGDIFSEIPDERPAEILGKRPGLFSLCCQCMFHLKKDVPESFKAEFLILALGILIHLVEKSPKNRDKFLSMRINDGRDIPGETEPMEAFIHLFLNCDANAKEVAEVTDNIIDEMDEARKKKRDQEKQKKEEALEETLNDLVSKAGKHMEETIIGANTAMLLTHCIWDNPGREEALRQLLPEKNFSRLIGLVEKYFNFVKLTATIGNTGANAVQIIDKVLKYLKKRDELKTASNSDADRDAANSSWCLDDSISLPLPDPDESMSAEDSNAVDDDNFSFSSG
ncbi:unnamed protein product [Notodromas monacha]|uniref:WAPL domain-containing protein n=1 Tax=Notodromas monacha TaxID=399045 RepID=A0A7R9BPA6_9CRUS|nr:unnamed protein product [Notodromas monacha]CAG0917822.1 unnamed protein product [Notodromas monacha]